MAVASAPRTIRLPLAHGGALALRDDVPATRGACPIERPCPHVRCRHHLWRIDDRPGRPWRGAAPPPTLRAAWLESPLPPSCALDVAERPRTERDTAIALGISGSRVRLYLARARRKLRLELLRRLCNPSGG